jgi:hypothetical protein
MPRHSNVVGKVAPYTTKGLPIGWQAVPPWQRSEGAKRRPPPPGLWAKILTPSRFMEQKLRGQADWLTPLGYFWSKILAPWLFLKQNFAPFIWVFCAFLKVALRPKQLNIIVSVGATQF